MSETTAFADSLARTREIQNQLEALQGKPSRALSSSDRELIGSLEEEMECEEEHRAFLLRMKEGAQLIGPAS